MNSLMDFLTNQIELDDQARQIQIKRAWEAYWGKLPKALKVKPGDVDDTVYANFCREIVDKGVSFLFGKSVAFEIDLVKNTQAEAWLNQVWRTNRKDSLLQKAAINGGVTGHVFIKIIERAGTTPRLVVLDPETVTVRFAVDDLESVSGYYIRYPSTDNRGRPVLFRESIEKTDSGWQIVDEISDDGINWRGNEPVFWNYDFSPVVDCQNLPAPNEFWGVSDLEPDIISLQLSINFVLSNLSRIIRFHAHPKTWGRGFTARDLRMGVDEMIVFPSSDAELHNLEMQSDLASSISFYQRLKEVLHEVSRIPEIASGRLENLGGLSGVALQVLYQPLLEKTQTKRRTYGDMLVELNRRLLAIGGFGNDLMTTILWPDMLPSDPVQERQSALIDLQLGASQDTLLQKLGYNPDLERQKAEITTDVLGEKLLTAFDNGK